MLQDLRHAARVVLQAKGWSAVILLSLALGIGASTAIFSTLNALLLADIPVSHPEGLVRLRYSGRNDVVANSSDYGFVAKAPDGQDTRATFSYAVYQQLRAHSHTMSDLVACAPYGRVNIVVDGHAEIANAFISTGNYYGMLGARARLGRTLLPGDDRPGAPPAAVISSKYWHSRFASEASVIGRTVRVNDVAVTIVGVIEPGFIGIQSALGDLEDVGLPLALEPQLDTRLAPGQPTSPSRIGQPTHWWLQVMGRLKPGTSAVQVQADLERVFQQTARAGLDSHLQSLSPSERNTAANKARSEIPRLLVQAGRRGVYDVHPEELRAAAALCIVVALVLLIVCVNVANLLLSRAATRQGEVAVKLSLGATRLRLVRQLLTESLLLALLGGLLGVVVGYAGQKLLPGGAGRAPLLDWRVLGFALAITLVTGIAFGIAPALRGTRGDLGVAMKSAGRCVVGSRNLVGRSLLVVQVAISLVLLVGAGLFLRTLQNLRQVDVGFDPEKLLLFRVSPQLNRYDPERTATLYRELLERLASVPGVRAAALTNPALLSGSTYSTWIFIRGRSYADERDSRNLIHRMQVSHNFFEVMRIPLQRGRAFEERDGADAPKVVVINEAAVRRFFPGEEPLGQRFGSSVERSSELEIIGVVRDAKYDSVRDAAPPTMYVPYSQSRSSMAVVAVRTFGAPTAATSSLRAAIRQLDPNLPMMDVSTQLEQVEDRFQQERTIARASALFGALALLLAAIGLFGLMSYSVARRTGEIGIRIALGAGQRDVLWLVLRECLLMVAIGVAIGVAAAFWASRFVTTLLYGLAPSDPLTLLAAVAVMVLVSTVAGLLPARQAARVDPLVALRYE